MRIIISSKAAKKLDKLNPFVKKKVLDVLNKVESGEKVDIKKMSGKKEEFRIRVGNYHIIMDKVSKDEYLATNIGKRENIYFFDFI